MFENITRNFNKISLKDSITISKKIGLLNFEIIKSSINTTILLCGENISQNYFIGNKIKESVKIGMHLEIIYAEKILKDIIYYLNKNELHDIQVNLAYDADAIVLIIGSLRSFDDFEAFTINDNLRNKLVCIVDEKHKNDQDYIFQRLVKSVDKIKPSKVFFVNQNNVGKKVIKFINSLKRKKEKSTTKIFEKSEVSKLINFVLPSIYLLEPLSKNLLVNLVSAVKNWKDNSFIYTTAALSTLIEKKLIEFTSDGYKLSRLGLEKLLQFQKRKNKFSTKKIELDYLRLEILNVINREKKIKI